MGRIPTLKLTGDNHHRTICQDLGHLRAGVKTGNIHRRMETGNHYYAGHEFGPELHEIKGRGHFLKIDTLDPKGKDGNKRTARRVIVRVNEDGTLDETQAWVWNHKDNIQKLGDGFLSSDTTTSMERLHTQLYEKAKKQK